MKTLFAAAITVLALGGFASAQEAPGADGMTHENTKAMATTGIDYTHTQSINAASNSSSATARFRWEENR